MQGGCLGDPMHLNFRPPGFEFVQKFFTLLDFVPKLWKKSSRDCSQAITGIIHESRIAEAMD